MFPNNFLFSITLIELRVSDPSQGHPKCYSAILFNVKIVYDRRFINQSLSAPDDGSRKIIT